MQNKLPIVDYYATQAGRRPFLEWFDRLRDREAQARIDVKIARLRAGLKGDWKAVGDGVQELRIDYGPGYRVYIGEDGRELVLLLCGGDKTTQRTDIERAKNYWADYRKQKQEAKAHAKDDQ